MFFRAGVLGQMEELRDERLSKIIGWLQSYIRGYIARKDFKKLQDQRLVNSIHLKFNQFFEFLKIRLKNILMNIEFILVVS